MDQKNASNTQLRVLFVCLGNICRSPAAEGIFRHLITAHSLEEHILIESAGLSSYTEGEPPDPRMVQYARERGYTLTGEARPLVEEDFHRFDLILTMDLDNYRGARARAPTPELQQKVRAITDFCRIHTVSEIPDPYYQTEEGFRRVLDILEDACQELAMNMKASFDGLKDSLKIKSGEFND